MVPSPSKVISDDNSSSVIIILSKAVQFFRFGSTSEN